MPEGSVFNPVQGGVYEAPVATAPTVELPVGISATAVTTDTTITPPVATVEPPATPSEPLPAPTFEDLLKEKSGGKYTKWEEVEPLLVAPTKEEVKYANEQSKKVHELILAGKLDEVIDTYSHQKVLANVDKLDDTAAWKLAMKYKDPTLTDKDIETEIADRFDIDEPEKPGDADDYLTEEEFAKANKIYAKELAAYEKKTRAVEREIKKEAKEARTFLESLKADIVLPDLPSPASAAPAAQQLSQVEIDKLNKSIQDSFEDAMVNLKSHNLKYAEDGVDLELGYDIPEAAKDDMIARFEKEEFSEILAKRYIKGDGSLDATKLMKELHLLENFETIQKSTVKQVIAKAKLDTLKSVKNVDLDINARPIVTTPDADLYNQFAAAVLSR